MYSGPPIPTSFSGEGFANTKSGGEGKKDSLENVLNLKHRVSLRIHHIDVGQGEATVIEYRVNESPHFVILIDGGRYTRGGGTIVRYLRKLGIFQVDIMVCTHHDADHIEGLVRVLEDEQNTLEKDKPIKVIAVVDRNSDLLSSSILTTDSFLIPEWVEKKVEKEGTGEKFDKIEIKKEEPETLTITESKDQKEEEEQLRLVLARFQKLAAGKKVLQLRPGDILVEQKTLKPDFQITCLHCDSKGSVPEQENNYSIAFLVQFGEFRYYTGGDLETHHEDTFAKTLTGGKHLCSFKCGHHGSKNSTSVEFLKTTQASHAVISCGRHSYYHPDSELVQRLCDATRLQWFDLTNCYYNRRGINPSYLNQEIALLKKLAPQCLKVAKLARNTVRNLLRAVKDRKGEGKTRYKDEDCDHAQISVQSLLDKAVAVYNKANAAEGLVSVLLGKDDGNCKTAFDTTIEMKGLAATCNDAIASTEDIHPELAKIRPEGDLTAWNKLNGDVKRRIRRCNTVVKACAELCERFTATKTIWDQYVIDKGIDPPVRGFVSGAKGFLGCVVLDIRDEQAQLEDHQFSVGVYNGGWTWKTVRCLFDCPTMIPLLMPPTDDLALSVEIKELITTAPWSPGGNWESDVLSMDSVLPFSETTGASGSTIKKPPVPLTPLELKEIDRTHDFLERAKLQRESSRNREQFAVLSCSIGSCSDAFVSRGLDRFTCGVCDTQVVAHRVCLKRVGFCPACKKVCGICAVGLDIAFSPLHIMTCGFCGHAAPLHESCVQSKGCPKCGAK